MIHKKSELSLFLHFLTVYISYTLCTYLPLQFLTLILLFYIPSSFFLFPHFISQFHFFDFFVHLNVHSILFPLDWVHWYLCSLPPLSTSLSLSLKILSLSLFLALFLAPYTSPSSCPEDSRPPVQKNMWNVIC